ncbi:MAG: lipase family protein [Halanaerobiales bacterium]
MDKQRITPLMQLSCFPEQKWKVINEKKDLDLAMWYKGDVLYINFKGSDSPKDWLFNFSLLPVKSPYKDMQDKYFAHGGFSKLYHIARDDIHNKFKKEKPKKIVIVGHSLGGALATLCYADFMWHKENIDEYRDVKIVGMASGSPRVGYFINFKNLKKYTQGFIRLTFNNDFVPRIPFKWLGFKHTGEHSHFGKKNWWPLTTTSIYHHFRESYLNHLKDDSFKDNHKNNYLYLPSIISIISLHIFLVLGIVYLLIGFL